MKESLSSPPGSAALGVAIPSTPHALSVSLPTWQDNINWAEREAATVTAMTTGYPRFFVHRSIMKLAMVCLGVLNNSTDQAMLFPTARTAEVCFSYLSRFSGEKDSPAVFQTAHFILEGGDSAGNKLSGNKYSEMEVHAVLLPPKYWNLARSCWQHAGMGISSRYAESVTRGLSSGRLVVVDDPKGNLLNRLPGALAEKLAIKQRIANMVGGGTGFSNPQAQHGSRSDKIMASETDVFLYPTGMSAIWHAHQLTLDFRPNLKCVCFGFSYTDTIKVLEKWGPGSFTFLEHPDSNLEGLESLLVSLDDTEGSNASTAGKTDPKVASTIAAIFCEFPSNPLLQSPDLPRLRQLADNYGFLIVVDETIGTFINADVFQYADIVTTSMSKLFSGSANVMGGSLVINPNSPAYDFMSCYLTEKFVDDYYFEDAVVMELNSRDFASRVRATNKNAEAVCDFLRTRSLAFGGPASSKLSYDYKNFVIKTVFYPKWVTRQNYDLCRRPTMDDNFGPLFTLTFTSALASQTFYNALQCAKGPSLGTNFTLSCPYTLLGHYNEREWAARYGVEEGLVRVSVGLEDRETLLGWIELALNEAENACQG